MNNKTKIDECIKFEKLIPMMFKNGMNINDYIFFKHHLPLCENCQKKYMIAKKIFNDFRNINFDISPRKNLLKKYSINEYQKIEENITGYIDNELSTKESLSVKRLMIKNSEIKKKFLDISRLINLIKNDAEHYKKRIEIKEKLRNIIYFIKK